MKEIHSRFVAEVRKGNDPVKAAKLAGIAPEQAEFYARKWLTKQSIAAALAAPEAPTMPKRSPRRRQAARKRVTRKK